MHTIRDGHRRRLRVGCGSSSTGRVSGGGRRVLLASLAFGLLPACDAVIGSTPVRESPSFLLSGSGNPLMPWRKGSPTYEPQAPDSATAFPDAGSIGTFVERNEYGLTWYEIQTWEETDGEDESTTAPANGEGLTDGLGAIHFAPLDTGGFTYPGIVKLSADVSVCQEADSEPGETESPGDDDATPETPAPCLSALDGPSPMSPLRLKVDCGHYASPWENIATLAFLYVPMYGQPARLEHEFYVPEACEGEDLVIGIDAMNLEDGTLGASVLDVHHGPSASAPEHPWDTYHTTNTLRFTLSDVTLAGVNVGTERAWLDDYFNLYDETHDPDSRDLVYSSGTGMERAGILTWIDEHSFTRTQTFEESSFTTTYHQVQIARQDIDQVECTGPCLFLSMRPDEVAPWTLPRQLELDAAEGTSLTLDSGPGGEFFWFAARNPAEAEETLDSLELTLREGVASLFVVRFLPEPIEKTLPDVDTMADLHVTYRIAPTYLEKCEEEAHVWTCHASLPPGGTRLYALRIRGAGAEVDVDLDSIEQHWNFSANVHSETPAPLLFGVGVPNAEALEVSMADLGGIEPLAIQQVLVNQTDPSPDTLEWWQWTQTYGVRYGVNFSEKTGELIELEEHVPAAGLFLTREGTECEILAEQEITYKSTDGDFIMQGYGRLTLPSSCVIQAGDTLFSNEGAGNRIILGHVYQVSPPEYGEQEVLLDVPLPQLPQERGGPPKQYITVFGYDGASSSSVGGQLRTALEFNDGNSALPAYSSWLTHCPTFEELFDGSALTYWTDKTWSPTCQVPLVRVETAPYLYESEQIMELSCWIPEFNHSLELEGFSEVQSEAIAEDPVASCGMLFRLNDNQRDLVRFYAASMAGALGWSSDEIAHLLNMSLTLYDENTEARKELDAPFAGLGQAEVFDLANNLRGGMVATGAAVRTFATLSAAFQLLEPWVLRTQLPDVEEDNRCAVDLVRATNSAFWEGVLAERACNPASTPTRETFAARTVLQTGGYAEWHTSALRSRALLGLERAGGYAGAYVFAPTDLGAYPNGVGEVGKDFVPMPCQLFDEDTTDDLWCMFDRLDWRYGGTAMDDPEPPDLQWLQADRSGFLSASPRFLSFEAAMALSGTVDLAVWRSRTTGNRALVTPYSLTGDLMRPDYSRVVVESAGPLVDDSSSSVCVLRSMAYLEDMADIQESCGEGEYFPSE